MEYIIDFLIGGRERREGGRREKREKVFVEKKRCFVNLTNNPFLSLSSVYVSISPGHS
jgi:hypothetical protein